MVEKKRYFSKVPGARYCFRNGTAAIFAHGFYDTENDAEQAELNEILPPLGNNPMIFTQETLKEMEQLPKVEADKNAGSEVAVATAERMLRAGGAKMSGDVNDGVVAGSEGSTVDPDLKNTVLASKATNPARDAALARINQSN